MQLALKGAKVSLTEAMPEQFEVLRSLPHGHVAAILETLKKLGLSYAISPRASRTKNLVIALLVARIINPKSKLATARGFHQETCSHSLGQLLNLERATEDELYEALDWLLERTEEIECKLAQKHLKSGSLVLYDVTSSYLEGTACALGKYGYNRDQKKGKTQIVYGLLCDANGCPIAVEVFEGNTALEDLGTICLNTVECNVAGGKYVFSKITQPTALQQKALDLLKVSVMCTQSTA